MKIPKNSKTRAPSLQFYPADWLNDIKLQSCSLQARGLLIDLICLMHQSSKYGYLLINGFTPPKKTVSSLLRLHHKTYDKTLKELLLYGVLKEDENGAIYCERMVKDEQFRDVRRKAGKLGGSPLLKQRVKQRVKQKPTPSSSSSSSSSFSSSSSSSKTITKRKFNEKEFDIFYNTYPNHSGRKDALVKWKKLIKTNELPELSILLTAIKKQIAWRDSANGAFRPEWKHPATWLNKGCWEDEGIEPNPLDGVLSEKGQATVKVLQSWMEDKKEKDDEEQKQL